MFSDSEDSAEEDNNGEIENGYFPHENATEHEDDQFDIGLPTSHRYLGKLDNVSNSTFYEDGEIVTLAAIQKNTLVFPGFTLPLVLKHDLEINMLQRHTKNKNVFVLLTQNDDELNEEVFPYGFVMEIYETHIRDDVLYLKAKSLQKCKLIKEVKTLVGQLYQVTVRVSAEQEPTSPLFSSQLNSLKQRRNYTHFSDLNKLLKCDKFRKYHLAQFPLAGWVYERYEMAFLLHQLHQGMADYQLVPFLPPDPVHFSYWFVQNFQLNHEERLQIMVAESTVQRLRLELRFLTMQRLIRCAKCNAELAKPKNVFPMSKDGIQSNYCNPDGFVYETVTVSAVTNHSLIGRPSTRFSWFPGYSWTIMQCKLCHSHIGWRFSSVSLKPNVFYGLAKSGLKIKVDEENLDI